LNWRTGCLRLPSVRSTGRWLVLSVALGLSFGCAQAAGRSLYKPEIPILDYTIMHTRCTIHPVTLAAMPEECSCLLTRDLKKLVLELKAACLALGWDDETCQTEPTD
jgi:hypothetical protein